MSALAKLYDDMDKFLEVKRQPTKEELLKELIFDIFEAGFITCDESKDYRDALSFKDDIDYQVYIERFREIK
jgi:hypothetical protein